MSNKSALSHISFWLIQHINAIKTQAEALNKDESITAEDKQKQADTLYRSLLSLLIIIKPAMNFAIKEYPGFSELLEWAQAILKDATNKNMITGQCQCNSCKCNCKSDPFESIIKGVPHGCNQQEHDYRPMPMQ